MTKTQEKNMQTPVTVASACLFSEPPTPVDPPGARHVRYSGRDAPKVAPSASEGRKKKRTAVGVSMDTEAMLQRQTGRDPLSEPPAILDPLVGDTEPTGKVCGECGTLCEWWIYNPFSARGKETGGWVKQSGSCHCSRAADEARDRELYRFERAGWDTGLSQLDLDAAFGKERRPARTFERFSLKHAPRLAPMKEACERFAEQLGELTFPTQGLLLVGPPSIGKKHLLAALTHQARRYEVSVVSLSVCGALQGLTPEKLLLLGKVSLLCLADLLLHPLMPSEIRTLDGLLETRENASLPTCFSAAVGLSALPSRFPSQKEQVTALLARVSRLADTVTAPPGTAPFTARMEKALR